MIQKGVLVACALAWMILPAYAQDGEDVAQDPWVASLQRAVENNPFDVDMRLALADVLAKRGRYEDAIDEYRRVIELSPKKASVFNKLGDAYAAIDEEAWAKQSYKTAKELRSKGASVGNERGQSQDHAPSQPAASTPAIPPLPAPRVDVSAEIQEARKRHRLKDYRGAAEIYREILEVDPDNARPFHGLGLELDWLNEDREAVRYYMRALDLEPTWNVTRANAALLHYRLGDRRQAERLWGELQTRTDVGASAYLYGARGQRREGYGDHGLALTRIGLRKYPADEGLNLELFEGLYAEGHFEEAREHARWLGQNGYNLSHEVWEKLEAAEYASKHHSR